MERQFDAARTDRNVHWTLASAQAKVKPYQETMRKASDVEANLVVGSEMPDTVKAQLKQMAGAKGQMSRWSQGLDKYTGDVITSLFSRLEKGTLGKLSQQDVDAMKAFTANVKKVNGDEINSIKESYRALQKEYKIPENVFEIPFSAAGASINMGFPGMDPQSMNALGIDPSAGSSAVVDGLVGDPR